MRIIRIFFSKGGEAAYISHLDLQRVMARALRRSGLPVWYSQGFNPHIYMSFSLPLPILQESLVESVDCKTEAEDTDFSLFIQPLTEALPRGITAQAISTPTYSAADIECARYTLAWPGREADAAQALAGYMAADTAMAIHKKKRSENTIDLKEWVRDVQADIPAGFSAVFPAGGSMNLNPALLAAYLEEHFGLPAATAHIVRHQVYTKDGHVFC